MPEFHAEPYIYLPSVSHKSVFVAWGAFYFLTTSSGKWKIVDDHDLKYVHPPRKDSIGARSASYGPARVEVYDATGRTVGVATTEVANHCWVAGLTPGTECTYKVFVKGEEWAVGERWDWSAEQQALEQGRRYDNRFRTSPNPNAPAGRLTFAVMGDFGVGMRKLSETHRQQQVADALLKVVDTEHVSLLITTGDNIYIRERILGEEAAGRASFCPGLFYKFRYGSDIEFVCIDRSEEDLFRGKRLFEYPKHWDFIDQSFPAGGDGVRWRIPFAHHPLFSAGPQHHNTRGMERLVPLFERAGVRVMFTGHEHNFQHSQVGAFHYFVTGAAGKLRRTPPDDFADAHTVSWATECHFLLARIDGGRMVVRAIGDLEHPEDSPADIVRNGPDGNPVTAPIEITSAV